MSYAIQSRALDASRHEIVLAGRLHASSTAELRAALDQATSGARTVMLDLTDLTSIDALALQPIVDAVKRTRPQGGEIVLFGMRATVLRLFELTGLAGVVTILASREEALRAVA